MARPVSLGNVAIVLRSLVGVADQHGDRRTGRHQRLAVILGQHARQDLHEIVFAPLRGEARLAGLAPVQFGLDVGELEPDARRATVDHAAKRRAVAFAPGGDAEEMAEAVV